MRKILYSPGFGAGWTTWEHDPALKALMLTYQPIIDALERGEDLGVPDLFAPVSSDSNTREAEARTLHPAVQQFIADVKALGKKVPYLGGIRNIRVAIVKGRVRINEYDGSESIEEEGEYEEWL